MPSTYSHYRFGTELTRSLPDNTQQLIRNNEALFHIGLHGPDICLYYQPMSMTSVKKHSFLYHKQFADELFAEKLRADVPADQKNAYFAYLLGFVCHFALDSVCHPYVEKIQSLGEVGHAELETNLDRYFMEKDGLDPMCYFPIHHILPTDSNAQIIHYFFDTLSTQEISECLSGMITYVQFFHAKDEARLTELYKLLEEHHCFAPMQGLIMKPSANPVCEKYYSLFEKLYTDALSLGSSLIEALIPLLHAGSSDIPSSLSKFPHRNFSAGDHWENLSLEL